MNNKVKVLSLFDGISCGQLALERAGFQIDTYYASEIDENAIKITQKNYPNTIQLGDVKNVVEMVKTGLFSDVDLLIGGSPCQGFSFAGKQLNFTDPRSSLFFDYVEILNELKKQNPNLKYLLENVKMKKEFQDIISSFLNVEPIVINSALLSAQNRVRLYWCNWKVNQPKDKGILLKDIIENGYVDRNKSLCIANRYAGFEGSQSYLCRRYFGKSFGQAVFNGSISEIKNKWLENKYFKSDEINIRPLTCVECERLQTLPDNYTIYVSEKNRKSCIGNGWTVDVIAHIFKELLA